MAVAPPREHPLWLKIPLNVSGPLGLGLALLGVVNVALGMLFTCVGFAYIAWELKPAAGQLVERVPRMSFALFVAVGAMLGALAWLAVQRHATQNVTQPNPTVAEQVKPGHSLLVRYSEDLVPISIHPQKTAYILRLDPNITSWFYEVANSGSKTIKWPRGVAGNHSPIQSVYVCELTNYEDKALLDVAIQFDISFHSPEELERPIEQHNADGTYSVTLPTPGPDHVSYSTGSPGHFRAFRDGEVVRRLTFSASLPAIKAGDTERVYLLNQSQYVAKFTFPVTATAIEAGQQDRVDVRLVRPNTTPLDVLPWFGLAPTAYDWNKVR